MSLLSYADVAEVQNKDSSQKPISLFGLKLLLNCARPELVPWFLDPLDSHFRLFNKAGLQLTVYKHREGLGAEV